MINDLAIYVELRAEAERPSSPAAESAGNEAVGGRVQRLVGPLIRVLQWLIFSCFHLAHKHEYDVLDKILLIDS